MTYHWRALYTDGSMLDEYTGTTARGVRDIDHTRLARMLLIPNDAHVPTRELVITPGMTFLPGYGGYVFRRIIVTADAATGHEIQRTTLTALGYAQAGVAHVTFYDQDGQEIAHAL